MRILAFPDIHGRNDKLEPYLEAIAEADVIILAGDLTNGSLDEARQVIETIQAHNTNILTIPGNMDTPEIVEFTGQMNIHRGHKVIDGVAFAGVGGALPFAGDYVFSDEQLADLLEEAVADVPAEMPMILVCHQPPLHTACDRLPNGAQVGSPAVRAFIEEQQPLICFTGHIHEARGIDTIGQTQIINPGPPWKGYALADIKNGIVTRLDIIHR